MRLALFALPIVAILSLACSSPQPASGGGGTTSQDVQHRTWPLSDPQMRADVRVCLPGPVVRIGLQQDPECLVVLAGKSDTCNCASPGLSPIAPAHAAVRDIVDGFPNGPTDNCLCEVGIYTGEGRPICESRPDSDPSTPGAGFCDIDAETSPPIGNVSLAGDCPGTSLRAIRVEGGTEPANWATDLFTICSIRRVNGAM